MTSRHQSAGIAIALAGLVAVSACTAADEGPGVVPFLAAEPIWETELDADENVAGVLGVGEEIVVQGERDHDAFVAVLDFGSGTELWRTDRNELAEAISDDVWVGESFVAFFLDKRTISVRDRKTGETERELELEPENLAGVRSYVLGFTGSIMYAVEAHEKNTRKITAVDVTTGEELWTDELDHTDDLVGVSTAPSDLPGNGSIAVGGDEAEPVSGTVERAGDVPVVLLTKRSDPGVTVALDGETGDELWRQTAEGNQTTTVVTTSTGEVVTLAADSRESCDVSVFVGSAESNKPREISAHQYRYDKKKDKWHCGASSAPGTLVTAGSVLTQDDEYRPVVIDLKTGENVWRADEPGIPRAFAEGVALYRPVSGGNADKTVAVDTETGKTLWASGDLGPNSRSVVANGRFLVDDGTSCRVWSLKSGESLWAFKRMTRVDGDGDDQLFMAAPGERADGVTLAAVKPDGRNT